MLTNCCTVLQVVLEYWLHEGIVVVKWCPVIHFCLQLLTTSTTQVKIISLFLPLDVSVSHFAIRDSLNLKTRVLVAFWSVSTWSPARGCAVMAFSEPVVSHQWIAQIVLSLRSSLATETRFIWIYTQIKPVCWYLKKPLSFLAKAGTLGYLKMWQVHQHQPHHADAGLSPQFQECNNL